MRWFLTLFFQFIWWILKAIAFVFKIFASYFLKCERDLRLRIKDEWKNRTIDDEIY
jgi:hypothetical protein